MTLSSELLTLVLKEGTDSLSFTEQYPHRKHACRHHGCLPSRTHISGSAPASCPRPILHLESPHLSRPAPNRTSPGRLSGALWLKVISPHTYHSYPPAIHRGPDHAHLLYLVRLGALQDTSCISFISTTFPSLMP